DGASDTYGTFAIVIGLLSWIFLIARILVMGAEINVVVARRIYPRSLFGDPATQGDRYSQAAQVTSERMHDKMSVDVEFTPEPDPPAPDPPAKDATDPRPEPVGAARR